MIPRKLRVVGVLLALAVSLGVGVVYLIKALDQFDDLASTNSARSYDDREIAGGNSIVINQEAAYEARALIPRDETYRVRTGPSLQNATSLTSAYVEGWFRYFLMPRRPAIDPRWTICYGCDVSELGTSFVTRWQDGNGISIGYVP
jgi:hypothetical protein